MSMLKAPQPVQDVCATIDDLYVFSRVNDSSDDDIFADLLWLFSAVCLNDAISPHWRRFLWGYAAGSFPVFAHDVCGIDNGLED